ncbi:bifunctional 3'-5' exonuclease/DNA polymerase [uncultured Caudovirales phage]|uniref:Bifunctional 3'-5' exonuclease/DNA polymerase n=1 Tax=uncultured Caudovirales phage TaxID=2100421 RepID=A0A6J5S8W4_9CAUD|nr:bifunctional 3'-5' exonuclease/DNA polymerase [uncultured Caudovirales phage]CAB4205534.1 bifunctional 3'-5' exonuclease/DNA polymerase [uncultured Caudovirales phage]CAB4221686.1 bifunctional 3'-5' exonuclease/DNA polymerase [uncultured Caudovirales phage]
MIYSIDFETRSFIDLVEHGLDIYANDESTDILCIAFGTNPDNVVVQAPTPTEDPPAYCLRWLLDHVASGGKIQAWNAMFEYAIWNCVCVPKYGWPELKLEQCIDSMAIAAANNIPQSLGDAAAFIDANQQKDTRGRYLIQKLCKPHKGVFSDDPELLNELFNYCKQDVRTELAVVSNLRHLSDHEQEVWAMTQRINIRGVPVDPSELHNAVWAVCRAQDALDNECIALTGCKPSERTKLLNWLNANGAGLQDLTAETVDTALQSAEPGAIRRALELRQEGSQTSVAKYAKMMEIQRNGRIRNTLVYHGASTGRWASRGGLNLQNIARPNLSDGEIAISIPRVFEQGVGSMQELSSLVRSAIKAADGFTFVDVDFSSIENRVGVWLANQKDKVELFRKGLDEYKVFASESLYRVPYDEVTKEQRQVSKSAVLGAMFGQGAKGLVKYAEGMGVKLSEVQAKGAVDNYRASYARVKNLWAACEAAAIDAVQNPGMGFFAGTKIKLKTAKNVLWMQLPSGRLICWQRPELELLTTPWGTEKLGVTVHSQNTYSRQWNRNVLIGSSIFQSAVQGTARDCLAVAMLNLEKAGYEVINSIHDEVLLLVEEQNGESALVDVINIMTTPPTWAPDFPLAAEGWFGNRYRK